MLYKYERKSGPRHQIDLKPSKWSPCLNMNKKNRRYDRIKYTMHRSEPDELVV